MALHKERCQSIGEDEAQRHSLVPLDARAKEWPARHNKRQGRTVVFSDKTTGLGDRSKDAELAKDAAGPGPYPAAMLAVAAVVAAFA